MADESKVEARENPIPAPQADDHEDVSWALSTARTTWDRGEQTDALKWLRRAAEAASEAEADDRALFLAKAAADLTTRIDEAGWDIGSSVRPPPTPQGGGGGGGTFPKATVRLSPLVPPAPPPSALQATRTSVPLPPPAPSPRAMRPTPPAGPIGSTPSPAALKVGPGEPGSSGSMPAGSKTLPTPPRSATGAALLGAGHSHAGGPNNAGGKTARPKHPSLGLLGPRPRSTDPMPPPLPSRASRPPVPARPPPPPPAAPAVSRAPTPPPPRVDAPAVIEAISSKNLVSIGAIPGSTPLEAMSKPLPSPAPPPARDSRPRGASSSHDMAAAQPASAEPFPLHTPAAHAAHASGHASGASGTVHAVQALHHATHAVGGARPGDTPLAPPPDMSSEVSQVIVSQNLAARESRDGERTTRPAGAWDDAQDDTAFAPAPVFPSGPESVTFVSPHANNASPTVPAVPDASQVSQVMQTGAAPTAPPASSQAIETILRNTNFANTEDMESWPTEAIAGNDMPNFSFDDATKTRIGQPAYREGREGRDGDRSSTSADVTVQTPAAARPSDPEVRASRPAFNAESRIAARGPVQKPSQAVRVVVWRGPDGVHVAPHGTTVTAISVDALLVALDPSADLFAWLTNK